MARIITVSSGKGGVGKTHISTNLALHLAQLGHKTCLMDADLGLANVNILLKLHPEKNLKDVMLGTTPLREILIHTPQGLDILPGASGIEAMTRLHEEQFQRLIQEFSTLDAYDYFIIDTAAGISRDVLAFCLAASEILLILTPDPASLTDAYALLKVLHLNGFQKPVLVLVNSATSMDRSREVLLKLMTATRTYLDMELLPIGMIPRDNAVTNALAEQMALILSYPQSPASRGIRNATQNLIRKKEAKPEEMLPQAFFRKFLDFFSSPLKKYAPKPPAEARQPSGHFPEAEKQESPSPAPVAPDRERSAPEPFDEKPAPSVDTPEKEDAPPAKDTTTPATAPAVRDTASPTESETVLSAKEVPPAPLSPPPDTATLLLETQNLLREVVGSIASVATELKEMREFFIRTQQAALQNDSRLPVLTPPESPSQKERHPLTDRVSSYPMFQTLSEGEIQEVLGQLAFKVFPANTTLLHRGDTGKNLFILVSGKVAVLDAEGGILDTMEGGDVFGEMSLISGEPVNATIRAMQETQMLYLDGRAFIRMLRTYPAMQMYFAKLLSQRLTHRLQKANLARNETPGSGLSGSLAATPIPELLQMLKMGDKTGLLAFAFPGGKAAISLIHGELVAARYGSDRGKEALYKILRESEGRFVYSRELPREDQDKKPMGHFMKLLMDGISMMDEERAESPHPP